MGRSRGVALASTCEVLRLVRVDGLVDKVRERVMDFCLGDVLVLGCLLENQYCCGGVVL